MNSYTINLKNLSKDDIEIVGGKNASLGEMINNLSKLDIKVPGGFATTSNAYRDFLKINSLDKKINNILKTLDVNDIFALSNAGKNIRKWILETKLPEKLTKQIEFAWIEMSKGNDISVAVRSSATAEDLPEASFAGQQETFLNIRGFTNLIEAIHKV